MYGDGCGQDMNAKAMQSIQMLSQLNSAGQMKTHVNESDKGMWHPFNERKSHCNGQHCTYFVWGKNIANKSLFIHGVLGMLPLPSEEQKERITAYCTLQTYFLS